MASSNFDIEDMVDYRPCWETTEVQQVAQGLSRLSERNGKAIVQRRRSDRKSYTAPVLIMQHYKGKPPEGPRMVLHLMARNLSRSGIAMLAPLFFEPEIPSKSTPMLRAATVFREGALLEIGLMKQSGSLLWLIGGVVRARAVQHDFLEIGIRFSGRRIHTMDFGV
jgi:hypothetical protein